MVVKFELTKPQADSLFWALTKQRQATTSGPLARAYDAVIEEVEARLADTER